MRKKNYDINPIGFDDSVYLLYSKLNSGEATLPKYGLILVDEYQDFNLLEVKLLMNSASAEI